MVDRPARPLRRGADDVAEAVVTAQTAGALRAGHPVCAAGEPHGVITSATSAAYFRTRKRSIVT